MSWGSFTPGANSGYTELLTRKGPLQIIASITEDNYQGDDLWLVKDWGEDPGQTPDRVGFLQIGWGSCSGCDALEDARGYGYYDLDTPEHELDEEDIKDRRETLSKMSALRDALVNDVKWFPTLGELLGWYGSRDWEGSSHIDSVAVEQFRGMIETHL